jgi:hypothetical protein
MYPDNLSLYNSLRMLVASCEKLRFEMGGTESSKNLTGLIDKWDDRLPTIFYFNRNLEWAKIALDKTSGEAKS